MKNLKLIAVIVIFSTFISGCQEEVDDPVFNPTPDLAEVEPTPCENPPLPLWYLQQLYNWGEEAATIAGSTELNITELALMHTIYFENSSSNQFFGANGEFTDQINNSFNKLIHFWDIDSDHMILVASRGSILNDRNKVYETYKKHFGYSDEKANEYADSVAILLGAFPQYLNGNHPAFTFNQLAIPDTTLAGVGPIPAKIIIGDGILEGYHALGYGDVAPQAILAHEYGHHIQYELGILTRGMELTPKTSRYLELLADAYAAYFMAHTRGGAMPEESMKQVSDVFYNIGDCSFDVDSHHGTPTQRQAATEWGFILAKDALNDNHILSSLEFASLFNSEFENFLTH